MDHAKIFDHIYEHNIWKTGSGPGSAEDRTRDYRSYLQNFLRSNRVKSVLDLGCGDWQFSRHIDWSGIDYVGADVSNVVLTTTQTFARPGIGFRQLDATKDPLPEADLLIAKDVLQHWSNGEILAFLPKLKAYRRALITNGFRPATTKSLNQDIPTGSWRPIDLKLPPFNVAGSDVFWFFAGEPKHVFLWSNPVDPVTK